MWVWIFQTIRNNVNTIINSMLMTAREIRMNTTWVILGPYFMGWDCWFTLIYFEISLGRIRVWDDEDWIQNKPWNNSKGTLENVQVALFLMLTLKAPSSLQHRIRIQGSLCSGSVIRNYWLSSLCSRPPSKRWGYPGEQDKVPLWILQSGNSTEWSRPFLLFSLPNAKAFARVRLAFELLYAHSCPITVILSHKH